MSSKLINHRFGILVIFLAVSLAIFTLTRFALFLQSFDSLDATVGDVLRIFGIGLVYDLAAFAYFSVPFVIYLALIPDRHLSTVGIAGTRGTHRVVASTTCRSRPRSARQGGCA